MHSWASGPYASVCIHMQPPHIRMHAYTYICLDCTSVRHYLAQSLKEEVKIRRAFELTACRDHLFRVCQQRTVLGGVSPVGERFGDVEFIQQQLPITVLYELAAPSVPDELVEDIMSK